MRWCVWMVAVCLALSSVAAAQTSQATKLTVGGSELPPDGTSVRLDGLGTSGGTNVLFTDSDGDVFERLLGVSDIPSPFTRDDVAETITQPWTWSAAVPQLRWYESDQSADERLWIALVNDKAWMLRAYTDDAGSSVPILTALRGTGTAVTSLTLHPRTYLTEHLYPVTGYTSDLATPSAKMRTLNAAELFIETIVAQERIATMGGRLTVTPSNVLTRDINTSTTTLCVKYNSFLLHVNGVELGSKIFLEKAGQYEAMYIQNTSAPTVDGTFGDYCYTVSRNADGSGANSWTAGDGIIDTGKTNSGMIDQFAVRGLTSSTIEGPSIDFLLRTGPDWDDLAQRASVGNLNGRYGYSADTWGLAAGDPAATYITAEATNGFRIIGPSNTVKFHAKTNGDIDLSGNFNLVTGGDIKSAGAFSLTAADGLLLSEASGVSDFPRTIRWGASGPRLYGTTNTMHVWTGTTSTLVVGGIGTSDAATIRPGTSSTTGDRQIGVSGNGWTHLWLSPPTQSTMSSSRYLLIADTDGGVKQLTDGFTGACSGPPLSVINGLIISC